ncbi:MAG: HNH endonuclease [Caulobacterales bacterium]
MVALRWRSLGGQTHRRAPAGSLERRRRAMIVTSRKANPLGLLEPQAPSPARAAPDRRRPAESSSAPPAAADDSSAWPSKALSAENKRKGPTAPSLPSKDAAGRNTARYHCPWPKPSQRFAASRIVASSIAPRKPLSRSCITIEDHRDSPNASNKTHPPEGQTQLGSISASLRRKPTRWLRRKGLSAQSGLCLGCGKALGEEAIEMDHIIRLALGGLNHTDNWAAPCPTCHRTKTTHDLRRIAKANRQRRVQEKGKGRAKSIKEHKLVRCDVKQHIDGLVTPRPSTS